MYGDYFYRLIRDIVTDKFGHLPGAQPPVAVVLRQSREFNASYKPIISDDSVSLLFLKQSIDVIDVIGTGVYILNILSSMGRRLLRAAALFLVLIIANAAFTVAELAGGISNVAGVRLQEEEYAARARARGEELPWIQSYREAARNSSLVWL